MKQRVIVPDIGDIDKVDVVEVLVSAGDAVAKDDPLVSLESDKATMDVPSPFTGTVREVKVKAGDKVGEGDILMLLDTDEAPPAGEGGTAGEAAPPPAPELPSAPGPASEPAAAAPAAAPPATGGQAPATREAAAPPPATSERDPAQVNEFSGRAYASPSVRKLARELGVDLERVRGSGRKGRILASDVQAWVKKRLSEPAGGAGGGFALPEMPVIDFSRFGEIERQPLSRIQRISGPHVHRSWLHVPHVTQHDEADITDLEAFRQTHKEEAEQQGFHLTPLAFVMKAVVRTLREFPAVNASLDPDGEHLIVKKYYHLGIAVDTPGGLVVPVVREVDRKGVFELARELAEVSARTRDAKLKPEELRGASFTISSLGSIGGTYFTPIVNAPEVAILGISRSRMQPVWRDGALAPRLILPLSLSYDHRVVDGAMAVRFTTYLCGVLSDIRRLLL
jgi:pyruvate dehydrogenase E2 component (dihydrolipoyllysine-residue acetyltransferase)